jgi:FkbM family methyltransferase
MYYSQWGEDEFLNNNYFHNKTNGAYIELGALNGVLYSNTKFFQDKLIWNGILIEPHPHAFDILKQCRPNNCLFNDLVSNSKEELRYKYFVNNLAAVSGIENTLTKHHFDEYYNNEIHKHLLQDTMTIVPKSLTEIIKNTPFTHFDFLSLDVEGHEYEVLQSWDFSVPIDVILIEMLGIEKEKEDLCRELLCKNGYIFDKQFAHNEIFIHCGKPIAGNQGFPARPFLCMETNCGN